MHNGAPEHETIQPEARQASLLTSTELAHLANKALLLDPFSPSLSSETVNRHCFICGTNTPNWGGGCMNCGALDSRA